MEALLFVKMCSKEKRPNNCNLDAQWAWNLRCGLQHTINHSLKMATLLSNEPLIIGQKQGETRQIFL